MEALDEDAMTRPACYIEGAALEISFADGRRNLQELIFDTVRAAGDDSGQPMHEIDSVVLAAHDLADGRSLSSMVTSPAAGACLRDEIRYGDDGAGALAAAVTRLEAATPAARSSRPGAGRVSTARTSSPGRYSSRSGPARWAWMSSCCPRCGPSCACPPAAGRDQPASGPRCGEWTAPAPTRARCAAAASGRPRIFPWTTRASGPWWSARATAPTTWPRTCTRRARGSPCCSGRRPAWSAWNRAARAYSIYREGGAPTEDCDLVNNSFPLPLLADLHKDMTDKIAQMDDALLRGLRAAGFQLDFGDDGSGFLMKYHRTGGGYYINAGCSDLIVAGEIAVRHGAEIAGLAGRTVRFTDGSTMDTDMIVVATGYQNMSESVRALFGGDVAARVGPVWGLDEEGEVRAMWRRTGQPGLWIMGGSLQQCRPYSKYLALQIKGDQEGLVPPAADRPS